MARPPSQSVLSGADWVSGLSRRLQAHVAMLLLHRTDVLLIVGGGHADVALGKALREHVVELPPRDLQESQSSHTLEQVTKFWVYLECFT